MRSLTPLLSRLDDGLLSRCPTPPWRSTTPPADDHEPELRNGRAATFDPLGDTFYAGDLSSGNIFTYDLSGNLLGTFNTGSGIDGLAVAGSTIAPQQPAATPSPTTVSFGTSPVGTPTASQTVTLHSTGTADLKITALPTIAGTDPGDVNITANTCGVGLDLPPGATCTTDANFDPTASGARDATLEFSDNAADSPQGVDLNGTGGGGSCFTGAWPSQLNGPGSRVLRMPAGFYLSVNPSSGKWTLQTTHKRAHQQMKLVGTVTTNGTLSSITPIRLEKADSLAVAPDQTSLTLTSHNWGWTDGVSFVATCGSSVTFQGSINGKKAKTTQIYLGSPATSPGTNPVTFTRSS